MTDNAELLRELVELRARNARLEERLELVNKIFYEDAIDCLIAQKTREVLEDKTLAGFADKVLKLAAVAAHWPNLSVFTLTKAQQELTPEEAKLLEDMP